LAAQAPAPIRADDVFEPVPAMTLEVVTP